ncbi:MAG TPA: HlyD family efflux transporter periplasmic adaptor subunit [Terracidiphilus sp.]|nr:HlyD family efflux transporter periplasmic adaptor subunit [Terracidiphilus sp.]
MRFHPTRNTLTLLGLASATSIITACAHRQTSSYQGYVEGRFVYVASPQSGRLEQLSVTRGETIAPGHPLFALDREPEASELRQAQQVLHTAQSRLADLQTGKRPAEVDVTRAQLAQARTQQKLANEILTSYQAQYRAGGIPQTDLINAQGAADSSAARVRELEATLAVDALPAREQQIKAQQNQVAADRASLTDAEWRLQQKGISAPRQGLVFDTLYRVGEWVSAGNPVVEMLPPENIELRFFIPEPVLGHLKVGQNISVHCDGCSSNIPAAITYISPQCEYTPPVLYSNQNRAKLVFMIIAKPPLDKAPMLHPGQPIEVTLQ